MKIASGGAEGMGHDHDLSILGLAYDAYPFCPNLEFYKVMLVTEFGLYTHSSLN